MKNKIFNYVTLAVVLIAFPYIVVNYLESMATLSISSYFGMTLIIPALVMFTMARLELGSSFQATAKANNLVTGGIYKKIRHPIYFSGLLLILGFIFLIEQFIFLIVWFGVLAMQLMRIKKEEKILEAEFGDRYLEYKKSTWF